MTEKPESYAVAVGNKSYAIGSASYAIGSSARATQPQVCPGCGTWVRHGDEHTDEECAVMHVHLS